MPWDLTGNSGTNAATDFLGTRDNQPLVIRTNGAEALRITGTGAVDVAGDLRSIGGFLRASNPNNQAAGVHLSWLNDVARIRVGGDGVGATRGLDIQTTADRSLMRILHNATVGIGTTNPIAGLHVSGTGRNGTIRIEREGKSLSLNPNWQGENRFARITTVLGSNMGLQLDTNEIPKLTITVGGNVGIGTTNPQEKLHVDGNVLVTGDITLSGADCAENFDVSEAEAAEPGTVMVIDQEGTLKPSEQPYDKRVAGVVSGAGGLKPGIVLDKQESNEGRLPVALVGKVVCNVDARHSPIEVGDLLTTSSTPGHAMKADDPLRAFGAVIGKALQSLKGGQGIIPVLIALQ
jgi:hypothetical protein